MPDQVIPEPDYFLEVDVSSFRKFLPDFLLKETNQAQLKILYFSD